MAISPKQITVALAAIAAGHPPAVNLPASTPSASFLAKMRPKTKKHSGEREAARRRRQAERNRAKAFARVGGEDIVEGWDCAR